MSLIFTSSKRIKCILNVISLKIIIKFTLFINIGFFGNIVKVEHLAGSTISHSLLKKLF